MSVEFQLTDGGILSKERFLIRDLSYLSGRVTLDHRHVTILVQRQPEHLLTAPMKDNDIQGN